MGTPSKMQVQLPGFFKIISSSIDLGLKIPDAFMSKHGGKLEEVVSLKVPTGDFWQVELVHYGDGSLLQRGWKEFAEFYSIKIGHFLVFRYEGNSQFLVLIFDITSSEIEYPSKGNGEIRSASSSQTFGESGGSPCVAAELNVGEGIEEEEDKFEVHQTARTSRERSVRVMDVRDDGSMETIDHRTELKSRMRPRTRSSRRVTEKGEINEENCAGILKSSPTPTFTRYCERKIYKEKIKSLHASKSSRPFFMCFMKPTHVSRLYRAEIPVNFTKEHLPIKKACKFMLCVPGDTRKWPVILKPYGKDKRAKITHGFKKFVEDNKLEVGDVCAFELGQCNGEFNIAVYRSAE